MGTASLEIVDDRSEACDEIKEHDLRNLLDPTPDARQVPAWHKKSIAFEKRANDAAWMTQY
jgi:hypothetical protein